MDELEAEMGVLQDLASRTPRFKAVDDLPLEPEDPTERRHASVEILDRFDGSQPQNQYFRSGGASDTRPDTRGASNEFLQSQFLVFPTSRNHRWEEFLSPFSLKQSPGEGISLSGGRVGSRM